MKTPKLAVIIRRAPLDDVPSITDIYNEAILTTTATFDTETKTVEDRAKWFQTYDERHPVLVAVVDNKVVGWASLTSWSDGRAYDDTAETSFFVHSAYRGRGVGRKLKEATIEEVRHLKFHTLIAGLSPPPEKANFYPFSHENPPRRRSRP